MAKKIFVSYKYEDSSVCPINGFGVTARDYVNLLEQYLELDDHIYKGEKDGEDLSRFKDETIQSHLRDNIFDSSVTIILISKNMRNFYQAEENQWIPWEISYSLKEKTREDRTSSTNGMLAVVIPDENGSYGYFVQNNPCFHCNSITWKTDTLFSILGKNMFNKKQPNLLTCRDTLCGRVLHTESDHSYIYPVKWGNFITNVNGYINFSTQIRDNIEDYNLVKDIP